MSRIRIYASLQKRHRDIEVTIGSRRYHESGFYDNNDWENNNYFKIDFSVPTIHFDVGYN